MKRIAIVLACLTAAQAGAELAVTPLGTHLQCWQRSATDGTTSVFLSTGAITVRNDKTDDAVRYPLPESFAHRLEKRGFVAGALPKGPWLVWLFFDEAPDAIHLVGAPGGASAGDAVTQRVPVPDSCLFPTFLIGPEGLPRLLAIGRNGIDEIGLDEGGLGDVVSLVSQDELLSEKLELRDVGHEVVDWTLDIDNDGLEDLLVLAGKSAEVYLQEMDGSLSHTDSVTLPHECGDFLWTSWWSSENCTFPTRQLSNDEVWMEPATDHALPNLTYEGGWFAQDERGVFGEHQDLEIVPDDAGDGWYSLFFRQVTECRVSADKGPGVAVIQNIWKDSAPEATVRWTSRDGTVPPLVFKRCAIPPRLTDLDRDGVSEVFAMDVPPLRKMIDMVLKMGFGSVELSGRFLALQKDGETWAQVSRSVQMQMSCWDFADQFGHFYDKFRTIEKVLLTDVDVDGDGTGDLVWPSPDGKVTVLFLESRNGRVRPKDRVETPVASNVLSLTPVGEEGGKTSVLVESVPEDTKGFDEDEWTPRAWHLLRWTD